VTIFLGEMEDQTIPEFFSGRSILVTGATGFMGKVLIEKLLRSCPDIDKIYLIIRNKRGKTIDQRMNEMKSLMVGVSNK
jgi:fatty acyl-CoA reductase